MQNPILSSNAMRLVRRHLWEFITQMKHIQVTLLHFCMYSARRIIIVGRRAWIREKCCQGIGEFSTGLMGAGFLARNSRCDQRGGGDAIGHAKLVLRLRNRSSSLIRD